MNAERVSSPSIDGEDARRIVEGAYRLLFERVPDPSVLAAARGLLANGAMTIPAFFVALTEGIEGIWWVLRQSCRREGAVSSIRAVPVLPVAPGASERDDVIFECYAALLGRTPDPTGLESFRDALRDGRHDVATICLELLTSNEGLNLWLARAERSLASTQPAQAAAVRDSHLFDADFYRTQIAARFASLSDPLRHFLTIGRFEGLRPNRVFDPQWYGERYGLPVEDAFLDFLEKRTSGFRDPSPHFQTEWYYTTYQDVDPSAFVALDHFIRYGIAELRNPGPWFDTRWYLENNPDVADAALNPFFHYIEHGETERRAAKAPPTLHLDEDFSAPLDAFTAWRSSLCETAFARAPRREGTPAIIRVWTGATQDASIEAMDVPLAQLSPQTIDDTARYVFLQDGDVLLSDVRRLMAAHVDDATALIVFDMVSTAEGRATPFLYCGANATFMQAVPADALRFAIAGWALRGALAEGATGAAALFDACLSSLRRREETWRFRHVAVPLVETGVAMRVATPAVAPVVQRGLSGPRSVGVVICTKDKGLLLRNLLRSLEAWRERGLKEIVVVSNQTSNDFAVETLRAFKRSGGIVVEYDKPFNFSTQCNLGAERCTSDLLLFMNDDISPIGDEWLWKLVATMEDPAVAMCGPLLLYPDESVQHAGMYLGYKGVAGHGMRGAVLPKRDGFSLVLAAREVSCLTGAVLLMRRSVFDDLNGFDHRLPAILQDVDLCLRVQKLGYRMIYNPEAVLFHMESVSFNGLSASRDHRSQWDREYRYFQSRHGQALGDDRFHNPGFEPNDETLHTLRA